jgi:hypothetical protein
MIVPITPLVSLTTQWIKRQTTPYKSHCKNGHALVEGNLYLSVKDGRRQRGCRTCKIRNAVALKQNKRKLRASLKENTNGNVETLYQYPFTQMAQDCHNPAGASGSSSSRNLSTTPPAYCRRPAQCQCGPSPTSGSCAIAACAAVIANRIVRGMR